ncbi:alpha/beta hydrolase [Mycolicibacterium thermoresistibile]
MSRRDIASRLDPALRHLDGTRTDLSAELLPAVRDSLDDRRRDTAAATDCTGVDIEDVEVPAGDRRIRVRVYRGRPGVAPAVLYCHAGAFVLGNLDTDHRQCVELARRADCTVVSVDYRLAPEHPAPAALDDAAAVLTWLAENAAVLRIDPARLAVAGSSAGGALAAGLAQRSGRGSVPALSFQLLHQPVLDDRPTPSKEEFIATPGFDGPACRQMWAHYLSVAAPTAATVPNRSAELSDAPPAFLSCSELDPLRDEALDYAVRLLRCGVPTELHVFPATCHGFDTLAPHSEATRTLFALQGAALRRALQRDQHPAAPVS